MSAGKFEPPREARTAERRTTSKVAPTIRSSDESVKAGPSKRGVSSAGLVLTGKIGEVLIRSSGVAGVYILRQGAFGEEYVVVDNPTFLERNEKSPSSVPSDDHSVIDASVIEAQRALLSAETRGITEGVATYPIDALRKDIRVLTTLVAELTAGQAALVAKVDALHVALQQAEAPTLEPLTAATFNRSTRPRTGSVEDMLSPFVADAEAVQRELAADPAMVDSETFARAIGVTPQAVHQKRKRGEVIGLTQGKRKVWFPLRQIDDHGRPLDGLAEVVAGFDGDEWEVDRFLARAVPELDGATGRQALLDGRKSEVLTAIRAIREGGFA